MAWCLIWVGAVATDSPLSGGHSDRAATVATSLDVNYEASAMGHELAAEVLIVHNFALRGAILVEGFRIHIRAIAAAGSQRLHVHIENATIARALVEVPSQFACRPGRIGVVRRALAEVTPREARIIHCLRTTRLGARIEAEGRPDR